jgi:hypothetical protein
MLLRMKYTQIIKYSKRILRRSRLSERLATTQQLTTYLGAYGGSTKEKVTTALDESKYKVELRPFITGLRPIPGVTGISLFRSHTGSQILQHHE